MPTILHFNRNKKKQQSISPKDRWQHLRLFVKRGQHRTFLSGVAATQLKHQRKEAKTHLRLPSNFNFDEEDTAGDKFSKIVTAQVVKLRHDRKSTTAAVTSMTADDLEMVQKDDEAYQVLLRCLLFPLLDHEDLVGASNESLEKQRHISFGQEATSFNGKAKVSAEFIKELKENVKVWLQENAEQTASEYSADGVYFQALLQFYDEIIKKRSAQVVQAGSSYDDLISIFQLRVTKEIESRIAVDISRANAVLTPFANLKDAIAARVLLFVDVVKQSIEEAYTNDMAQKAQQNRKQSRMALKHKRNKSKAASDVIDVVFRGHTRQSTEPQQQLVEPSELQSLESGKFTKSSITMLEYLKDTFRISRGTHEKLVHDIANSAEAQVVVQYFKNRLENLDTMTFDEQAFSSEGAFQYWRKIERRNLQKYVSRIDKLYINTEEPKPSQSEPLDAKAVTKLDMLPFKKKHPVDLVKLRVRIIEAKNLAIKDTDGVSSDPYAVIEWGKERYETKVVSNSLFPLWDQDVTMEIDQNSHKPIKVSVWDKDEGEPGVLTSKYWKDEADDFLGQVSFDIATTLKQLDELQQVKAWFPLEKRSRRSHVSGEIHIVIQYADQPQRVKQQSSRSEEETLTIQHYTLGKFGSMKELYAHVLLKLLQYDSASQNTDLSVGTLSQVSEQILNELAERWRIDRIWVEYCHLKTLVDLYINPATTGFASCVNANSMPIIISQYNKVETLCNQALAYEKSIRLIAPPKVEVGVDGQAIVNKAIVSGVGETVLSKELLQSYSKLQQQLFDYQKSQVQHYKDCFPCDTPSGALVDTLTLMNQIADSPFSTENSHYDSGIAVNNDVKKPQRVNEILADLIQGGTVERFMRMSELATPMKEDVIGRLVKLGTSIAEELAVDTTYFKRPFAADLNIVHLTTSIYLKYFTLEMETLSNMIHPSKVDFSQQPKLLQSDANIFELYYCVKELQEKFLPNIIDEDGDKSVQDVVDVFSVHRWIAPFIHLWLVNTESQLFSWVKSSLSVDKFEALNPDYGMLHSTSVVDLFFCFNQIIECLNKLDWLNSGGVPRDEDDQNSRKLHWFMFLTRMSRTLNQGICKYGESLSMQVMNERLQFLRLYSEHKNSLGESLDVALSSLLSPQKKEVNASTKSLNQQAGWIAGTNTTKLLCVKVNNIEAARQQLNEIYDHLAVRDISDWMSEHKKNRSAVSIAPQDDLNELSGCLTLKVVSAENLMACDAGGASDPYCVVKVTETSKSTSNDKQTQLASINPWSKPQSAGQSFERQIAKTRILPARLNARWDEEFSTILRYATAFTVTVYDYDIIGKDDICGQVQIGTEKLKTTLADGQSHDVVLDIKPQGKVLLRMQVDSAHSVSNTTGMADIEFYFRKSFRELKRYSLDLLGLFSESIGISVRNAMIKILIDSEKQGRQGAGQTDKAIFSLSSPISKQAVVHEDLTTDEEIEAYMTPLTDHLNDTLQVVAQNLYPRLTKELLRRTWKEILLIMEACLVPSLYGEHSSIQPLNRAKPLTQKQAEVVQKCTNVLKLFFYADGDEVGVPMEQLESRRYKEIEITCQMYWKEMDALVTLFDHLVQLNEKNSDGVGADTLLKLVRIRAVDSKSNKAIFDQKMSEREKRVRFDNEEVEAQ